jgi:hemerythrin-like metal-binding protein
MTETRRRDDHVDPIDELERQRRILFRLILKLSDLQEKDSPKYLVERFIKEVGAYLEYHLLSKENFMFLTNSPDLQCQEVIHAQLLLNFREEEKRYKEDRLSLESLIRYLKDWFLSHTEEKENNIG